AVVSESALPPSARTESAAQPVPVERSSAQSTEPDGRPVAPAAENRPVARSLIQESAAVPPADAERPEFQASKQMAPDWAAAVVTPSPESGGHPLADAKLAPPASASQALPQAPGEFPAEPQVLAESAAQEPQPAPDAAKAGGSGAGKMPAEAGASPTGSRPDTPQPDGAKPQVLASLFKDLLGVDILSEPLVTATVTRAAEPGRDPASMPSQAGPTGEPESPQLQSPVQAEGGRPIPGTVTAGVDAQAFRAELKLLLHKAEGALAGIVTDQLASLPQVDGRQAVWQLEIPYQFGERADALLLKVVREGKRGAPPLQCFWSVTLELHPPGLGTVHARISLSAGNVDSYFWSDRAETSQAIRSHLDLLAARLQQAGLSVGRLDILPSAPAGLADGLPGAGSIVLDERA
ncbi:MAG: hypothetical protein FIA97_20395, partial [Methylococcaceae bacterium]|nr:hypothetical protein [Methylococcaceae bacterium]